ncbi:MAG: 3-phosphoserine/phosphohydroxythreonine transaminase [Sporomusaceae bacterium]|nr:3-phosphoserine/phosphohydroxythreonine transaminase [Sporomusaceae bacterium]
MTERVYNFNPGPAVLPLEVLEEAQQELLSYRHAGMSVLEMSHRSKPYEAIHQEAEAALKSMLGVDESYRVLFLQGGASLQFAMIPLNYLPAGRTADYLLTGVFAEKAWQEAKLVGNTHVAASTAADQYRRVPAISEIVYSDNPVYVHMTSNNTIYGTQWTEFPETGETPLVVDMSSDILSRPVASSRFALLYAGAQKNLGAAGVTVVVIRRDLLERCPKQLSTMLRYDIHANNDSLYNTPPGFSVYLTNLNLLWLQRQGGPAAMELRNREKAGLVYTAIDNSGGFYRGHAEKDSRSLMNVTFRLPSEELEDLFVREAAAAGMVGLKGHRLVGGMRASLYNAMTKAGCQALADFMTEFHRRRG